MTRVFVRHQVSDYAAWRKVYDSFAPVQKANGVIAESVYRSVDDPNDVTVIHDFATADAAHAFTKLEELGKAMESSGVVGAPTVWFSEKA